MSDVLETAKALLDQHAPCDSRDCGFHPHRKAHCDSCEDWLIDLDHPCEVAEVAAAYVAAAAEREDACREADRLRAKLERVRDFLAFHANSDGGLVAEIDHVLAPPPGGRGSK